MNRQEFEIDLDAHPEEMLGLSLAMIGSSDPSDWAKVLGSIGIPGFEGSEIAITKVARRLFIGHMKDARSVEIRHQHDIMRILICNNRRQGKLTLNYGKDASALAVAILASLYQWGLAAAWQPLQEALQVLNSVRQLE